MRRRNRLKGLALVLALLLALPLTSVAEQLQPEEAEPEVELGEVDLFDLLEPGAELPVTLPEDVVTEEPADDWEIVQEDAAPVDEDEAAVGDVPETESAATDAPPVQGEETEPSGSIGESAVNEGIEMEPEPEALAPETEGEPSGKDAAAVAEAEPDLRLGVGERYALKGGTGYRSDAPEVASVDGESGALTGVAPGHARITALGADGLEMAWLVAVLPAPDAIAFEESKLKLGVGEKLALSVSLPEGTAASGIAWSSSKKSIVTVDGSGRLKAKKRGTAVITARTFNGAKAKCRVQVVKAPSKVKLSAKKLVLCVGESGRLKAKLPSGSASRIAWKSGNADVVAVDGSGALTGVTPGTATVRAITFNGKKASCKVLVLDGSAPTEVSAGVSAVILGLGEKLALAPSVGEGEATVFAYASSKKKVAAVSGKGVITGKKRGKATIAVRTHNGLVAKVQAQVVKAPSGVAISRSKLSMKPGETAQLSAWVPSGSASVITWTSGAPDVVSVDAEGNITALKPGTALVRARTYNKKNAWCTVTVAEDGPSVEEDPGDAMEEPEKMDTSSPTARRMAANLRASGALGSKRTAIANVVELLVDNGFEPAFAAGVGANIYAEGAYGLFESSRYVTSPKKRPRYFCYLDGGNYYTKVDGEYKLTAVYLSEKEARDYDGRAEVRLRFGEENFYLNNYSKKYAWEVDLNGLEALMEQLAEGGWEGKFGLGIVQWTGSRTKKLVSFYRKHAGSGNSITAEQVVAAENEMILHDLKGSYSGVYSAWKSANKSARDTAEAARSAGSLVCTRYEIPADKDSKAVTRGKKAVEIYRIMVGG